MNEVNESIRRSQADSTLLVTGTNGGSTTLTPGQRRVKVTAPGGGTHTINLPSPKDCPGDFQDVEATDGVGTVTVAGTGMADQVITVAGHVVAWSNNESWRVIAAILT